jgi:phosphoribosylanthranilate isomerase
MEIKICGITRLEDALCAINFGVNWLGFNFVPASKRYIAPAAAAAIIAQLPRSVHCVGVFMNQSPAEIRAVLQIAPLDVIQFHGEEPAAELAEFAQTKIKVFAVDQAFAPCELLNYEHVADYFLFDTKVGSQSGGTGAAFDWSLIPRTGKPFFLAGGIGPANLAEAIKQVRPYGVDLNSKLESAPGVKDPQLVEQCVAIVTRDANGEYSEMNS